MTARGDRRRALRAAAAQHRRDLKAGVEHQVDRAVLLGLVNPAESRRRWSLLNVQITPDRTPRVLDDMPHH